MMFLDNQQIDADLLNGIAKDLGATDFSAFADGEKFGVDKLNEITKALVTSGVISNADGTCKVTVSDGMISVGTGTIVFNSGAKMKITENQTLELVENTKTYVVAVNDTTNNRMLLYNLEAEPTEDDYVLLAEVLETGEVLDKRAWSTARVAGMLGAPVYERFNETVTCTTYSDIRTLSKVIRLTRSGYHCIYIPKKPYSNYTNLPFAFLSLGGEGCSGMFYYSGNVIIHFIYDGKSTVEIYTERPGWVGSTANQQAVEFDMYFF